MYLKHSLQIALIVDLPLSVRGRGVVQPSILTMPLLCTMRYLTTQTRQLKNSSDKRCESKNKAEDAKPESSNMW